MRGDRKPIPAEVLEARTRIDAWRAVRKGGTRMPEALWEEAVSLAEAYGIWRVSRALSVSDIGLSQRIKARGGMTGAPTDTHPSSAKPAPFVALEGNRFPALMPSGPMVEVVRPTGTRLVIHLVPGSVVDVGALVRAFAS